MQWALIAKRLSHGKQELLDRYLTESRSQDERYESKKKKIAGCGERRQKEGRLCFVNFVLSD